jgi:hypothetical protein
MQCEKLRELILGDRIPRSVDEDRKKMQENSEDVERHFRSVWDPRITPDWTFIQPKEDSPSHIPSPVENSLNLDGSFADWMRNENEIRTCLESKLPTQ